MILKPNALKLALQNLRAGEAVAVPTETVYGLAGDISQPKAIERIFSIKRRPHFDPLIVHIADLSQLPGVARDIPQLAMRLAETFWPGPLTMVLPKQATINPMITSGLETVAIRMPKHELTRELIRQLGHPVAAPSANLFGKTSPTSADHVELEFSGQVPVLDGGRCEVGIESTVVTFKDNGRTIVMLRPGAVTVEDLSKFAPVEIKRNDIHSPGHLRHHYMPEIPLVVLSDSRQLTVSNYEEIKHKLGRQVLHPAWMSLPDNALTAARLLYSNMRVAATEPDVNCIFLEYPVAERRDQIWTAISDRLEKAATVLI